MLCINNNVLTSFVGVLDGLTDCRNDHGDLVGSPRSAEVTGQNPWGGVGFGSESGSQQYCGLVTRSREQCLHLFSYGQSVPRQPVRKLLSLRRPQCYCAPGRFLCSSSCQRDQLFLWGPESLTVAQGVRVDRGRAGSEQGCRCRSRRAWLVVRAALPSASCRWWLTGATPFVPSRRPLGN